MDNKIDTDKKNNILEVNSNINKKLECFKNGCKDLVIITDFDFTLTHRYGINGENYFASFGCIETFPKLSKKFRDKMIENYNYYAPKEYDLSLSLEERRKLMNEWTTNGFEMFIKEEIHKENIKEIVEYSIENKLILLRKDAEKIFKYGLENNVNIYILSAGIQDIIEEFLHQKIPEFKELVNNNLVHIVSNKLIFNNVGLATDYKKPVLNTFAKVDHLEIAFKHHMKNAVIFGDHHHDSLCVEKLILNNTISIAFVNYSKNYMEKNKKEIYKRYLLHWDVILFNESSFEYCIEKLDYIKDLSN